MLFDITSNERTENMEIEAIAFKRETSETLHECDIRNDKGEN